MILTSSNFLFVYGTLMSGFDNEFAQTLQKHTTCEGKGYFKGKLYRISWYPGAIHAPESSDLVFGEVYRMEDTNTLLPALDEYEEVTEDASASLYLRQIIPVSMEDGRILSCWVYLYNQPTGSLQPIPGGRFTS